MQDSNAGGICKGPWAAYRAVEDHEALVEVVVLQRGVAVQLGQRVLASDGAGRGGGGERRKSPSAPRARLPVSLVN